MLENLSAGNYDECFIKQSCWQGLGASSPPVSCLLGTGGEAPGWEGSGSPRHVRLSSFSVCRPLVFKGLQNNLIWRTESCAHAALVGGRLCCSWVTFRWGELLKQTRVGVPVPRSPSLRLAGGAPRLPISQEPSWMWLPAAPVSEPCAMGPRISFPCSISTSLGSSERSCVGFALY